MPKITVMTPSIRPNGLERVQKSLEQQTFTEFEWLTEVGLTNTEGSDLNKAYNRMIRRAEGELMVSVQDYTKVPDDGLERFWKAHEQKPAFYTAPSGLIAKEGDRPKWDWRESTDADCNWMSWEIDYGSAPLDALREIGGFDERLDDCWGFDNVNVGFRADRAGYEFFHLPENKAITINHDLHMEHPHRNKRNPRLHERLLADIKNNGFNNNL